MTYDVTECDSGTRVFAVVVFVRYLHSRRLYRTICFDPSGLVLFVADGPVYPLFNSEWAEEKVKEGMEKGGGSSIDFAFFLFIA